MKLNNKKAMNTLDYAVEYFNMNYDSGDKKNNEELKNAVYNALNYVEKELKRKGR
tara:strand:+ start:684 stop:848 length:165 start_codon:yes stop_codon:yes gene_type:complete